MTIYAKRISYLFLGALAAFLLGFALASGVLQNKVGGAFNGTSPDIKGWLYHHIASLEVNARHYFMLPSGSYTGEIYLKPLGLSTVALLAVNGIFNILFQPVFFCPFTPQVIINVLIFPFFLYGSARYFTKVWPMLAIFIVLSFRTSVYDSVVEALIRHGMPCELIYLLVGLAGFTGWTARNSSS